MPILAKVEVAKLLLGGGIGKQKRIHVFGIELKLVRGIVQRTLDCLIYEDDRRIRTARLVQNQNPPDVFRGCRGNRVWQENGCQCHKQNPEVTSSPALSSRRGETKV